MNRELNHFSYILKIKAVFIYLGNLLGVYTKNMDTEILICLVLMFISNWLLVTIAKLLTF